MIKPAKNKHNIRIAIMVLILSVAIVIVLLLQITEIKVIGNEWYTDEQIIHLLFQEKWDKNAVYCYGKDRLKEHEKIPFVEDYKIVFQSPREIEIIVYEKSVVGYISYMSSNMYFDKDGIVVESTNEILEGVPLIAGLKFGHIVLHQPLPVQSSKIFEEILNLTQVLSVNEIGVNKIQYSSQMEATLLIGEIEVTLGSSDNINGKIVELRDMLPSLTGLKGVLHLETYDETNSNLMYTFIPSL